jgi:hypothetical protein
MTKPTITPQEVAQMFDCWVAMDMDGDWWRYSQKPELDYSFWNGRGILIDCLDIQYTGDWKDSLFDKNGRCA